MRSAMPWVVVLAAAVVGGWFLWTGGREEEPSEDVGSIERDPVEAIPDEEPTIRLEGVEPPRSAHGSRPRRYPPQVPLSQVPRGEIRVKVVDEEGTVVPSQEIRLVLEEVDRRTWQLPMGTVDPESGLWKFVKVPVGRVRLHASGDYVLDTFETVEVSVDQVAEGTLTLRRAGAVTYAATLFNGEVPEKITVSLRDEKGRAVPAWWQVRTTTVLTEPRRGAEVSLGAEGIAYGVPPGRYKLRAKSPGDDVDEQEVLVEAGKTAAVKLSFRE